MQILDQWDLRLDADAVLRGQGADPIILRSRKPRLFEIAVQALEEGLPLNRPHVMYERSPVEAIRHARIRLAGGSELKGEALAQHLGPDLNRKSTTCDYCAMREVCKYQSSYAQPG